MAGRLLSLLAEGPGLIVSLPRNDVELARAAAAGGAGALKVHINVHHEASGTHFGSLDEERGRLEEILALGLPTGIVPGAGDRLPIREEMEALAGMGVDFFDLYVRDTPAWLVGFSGMTRAIAISSPAQAEMLPELKALGFQMIEAAIIPHQGYGRPLCVDDLVGYRRVRAATDLPIIVPSQRALAPRDASLLVGEIGMNAIMIGAVVTGREAGSLRAATERFAEEMARR